MNKPTSKTCTTPLRPHWLGFFLLIWLVSACLPSRNVSVATLEVLTEPATPQPSITTAPTIAQQSGVIPSQTASPIPSDTPAPSETALPSATVPASDTPVPPTETLVASVQAQTASPNTDTPVPVQVSDAPSAVPATLPPSAPDYAAQGLNPLTGLPIDPSLAGLRPINVKVSNLPACVRPQTGLNAADVVFEHYVEAWYTRFTAIFHSQYPEKVGSVRSARMLDLELPAIFSSGFLFSGASAGVQMRVKAIDFKDRALYSLTEYPALYRVPINQTDCTEGPHNMFANTKEALSRLAVRNQDKLVTPISGWYFAPQAPVNGLPATHIELLYENAPMSWDYDAPNAVYLRTQGDKKHYDRATREQLRTYNVVLLYANQVYTDFPESPSWYSLEIQFWGTGNLVLFRDGQAYSGRWERPTREGLFRMYLADGTPLTLHPGNTWFQMVGIYTAHANDAQGRWQFNPEELPLKPVKK
ncbi:MAG TPA: DUF3048 domain-containing protein [Anaerolineales bacterium]|nr:DUF3048 domain-containing protein [Anaerolineales bacterium]